MINKKKIFHTYNAPVIQFPHHTMPPSYNPPIIQCINGHHLTCYTAIYILKYLKNSFFPNNCKLDLNKSWRGKKIFCFPILQKPFLGGVAAYSINSSIQQDHGGHKHIPGADLEVDMRGQHYHAAVVYEFVLCSAVVIALLLLVLWHVRMISCGETNIEVYINRKEVDRLKKLGLVSQAHISLLFYAPFRRCFSLTHTEISPV